MAENSSGPVFDGLEVVSVEFLDGEDCVYDITVEVDESFIVCGAVVHNCQSCRSLDGRQFPPDKGPRPPLHVNCRCTLTPVLDEKYAKLMKGATRASKGAEGGQQVSADLSYYDWLKTQPAEFQDDVLGPTRAKLFRDGDMPAWRFAELNVDKYFAPMTLDEMKARNPIVFQNAGL